MYNKKAYDHDTGFQMCTIGNTSALNCAVNTYMSSNLVAKAKLS